MSFFSHFSLVCISVISQKKPPLPIFFSKSVLERKSPFELPYFDDMAMSISEFRILFPTMLVNAEMTAVGQDCRTTALASQTNEYKEVESFHFWKLALWYSEKSPQNCPIYLYYYRTCNLLLGHRRFPVCIKIVSVVVQLGYNIDREYWHWQRYNFPLHDTNLVTNGLWRPQ